MTSRRSLALLLGTSGCLLAPAAPTGDGGAGGGDGGPDAPPTSCACTEDLNAELTVTEVLRSDETGIDMVARAGWCRDELAVRLHEPTGGVVPLRCPTRTLPFPEVAAAERGDAVIRAIAPWGVGTGTVGVLIDRAAATQLWTLDLETGARAMITAVARLPAGPAFLAHAPGFDRAVLGAGSTTWGLTVPPGGAASSAMPTPQAEVTTAVLWTDPGNGAQRWAISGPTGDLLSTIDLTDGIALQPAAGPCSSGCPLVGHAGHPRRDEPGEVQAYVAQRDTSADAALTVWLGRSSTPRRGLLARAAASLLHDVAIARTGDDAVWSAALGADGGVTLGELTFTTTTVTSSPVQFSTTIPTTLPARIVLGQFGAPQPQALVFTTRPGRGADEELCLEPGGAGTLAPCTP